MSEGRLDHRLEARLNQAKKFRALYRSLGHTAISVAKFLQVSEASVYRWQRDGGVPTLVLRFLRLHACQELPGKTWAGWHFSRDTLWTPEGHGFTGKDFAWLSLTIRRSEMFTVLYRERAELRAKLLEARYALAKAEEEAITAEGRAGVLELAIWGLQARERRGLSVAGDAADRALRGFGGTRDFRYGPVTRTGSLTGETFRPEISHRESDDGEGLVTPPESFTGERSEGFEPIDQLLDPTAKTLPDGSIMPWRVSVSRRDGGAQ